MHSRRERILLRWKEKSVRDQLLIPLEEYIGSVNHALVARIARLFSLLGPLIWAEKWSRLIIQACYCRDFVTVRGLPSSSRVISSIHSLSYLLTCWALFVCAFCYLKPSFQVLIVFLSVSCKDRWNTDALTGSFRNVSPASILSPDTTTYPMINWRLGEKLSGLVLIFKRTGSWKNPTDFAA